MGVASVLVVFSCCLFHCSARSLFLNLQNGNNPLRTLTQRTANPSLLRRRMLTPTTRNGQSLTQPTGATWGPTAVEVQRGLRTANVQTRPTARRFRPQNQRTHLRNRNTSRLPNRSVENLGMSNLQNRQEQFQPGQTIFDPRVAGGNRMVGNMGDLFGTGAYQDTLNPGFSDYSGIVNENVPIDMYDPGTRNEYLSQQQEMGFLPQSASVYFDPSDPLPLVPGQVVRDFRIPGGAGVVGKADGSDGTIIGAGGELISKDGTDMTRKVPDYSPMINLGYSQNSGVGGLLTSGSMSRNTQLLASPGRPVLPTRNVQTIRSNVKRIRTSGTRPRSSTARGVASSRRIENAGRINRMRTMPRNRNSRVAGVASVASRAHERKIQQTRALMQASRVAAMKAKRGQSENVKQNIADLQGILRGKVMPLESSPTLKKHVGQIILDRRIAGGAGVVAGADGTDGTIVGVKGNVIDVDGTDMTPVRHV